MYVIVCTVMYSSGIEEGLLVDNGQVWSEMDQLIDHAERSGGHSLEWRKTAYSNRLKKRETFGVSPGRAASGGRRSCSP